MTEQSQPQPSENNDVEAPESAVDESTADTGTETPAEPDTDAQDDEPAEDLDAARLRGDNLYELLLRRSIEQGTAGVLTDPASLSRDADLYDDETGLPDVEKIRAAAVALADAKPQLAPVAGNIGQGVRETVQADTWSTVFRNAVNG